MPQAQLFRLEAEVRCADGDCGKLRTLVISRGDDAVTHLVVEPAHRKGPGRIVPLGLVDTGGAGTGGADTGAGGCGVGTDWAGTGAGCIGVDGGGRGGSDTGWAWGCG